MTNKDQITMIAVGDIGPLREHAEELFDPSKPILKKADIVFGQMEKLLSERGKAQLQLPHSLARANPRVGKVMADTGFNIVSCASNHLLTFGEEAALDTFDNLAKNHIKVIGAGVNMREARKPAVFEINGTKVGFLAYCSVVSKGYQAGPEKPGVVPVRVATSYEQVDWQPGTPPRVHTKANPGDMAAMIEDIQKLRPTVDVLVVSHHWGVHYVPAVIADYQYEVGHATIDAGADIIFGSHTHVLKGIEVYKGKVIFYSLGNYAMEHPRKNLLTGESFHLYNWETDPEYTTYSFPVDAQKTMLAKTIIADKRIKRVSFLPMWVNKQGQAEPLSTSDPRNATVAEYMEWLCRNQRLETKFSRDGDEVVVLA